MNNEHNRHLKVMQNTPENNHRVWEWQRMNQLQQFIVVQYYQGLLKKFALEIQFKPLKKIFDSARPKVLQGVQGGQPYVTVHPDCSEDIKTALQKYFGDKQLGIIL